MEMHETKSGYWAGMPARLKAHLIGWSLYWALALWLALTGSMIGISMLVLPVFWFIAKVWLFDSFLELERGGDTVLSYTLDRIWNGPAFVRSTFIIVVLVGVLGGIGWLGTEDMRKAAAAPTFSERVSETAGNVADATADKAGAVVKATKSTTKGWIARTKGWFSGDDDDALSE